MCKQTHGDIPYLNFNFMKNVTVNVVAWFVLHVGQSVRMSCSCVYLHRNIIFLTFHDSCVGHCLLDGVYLIKKAF